MSHRLPLCLALALLAAGAAPAEEALVDGIAAQVGPDVVLISDVMKTVGPMEESLRNQGAPESEIAKLRAEGLERMIEWRLIEQLVRQTEMEASDEEIDDTIERIAGENGLTKQQLLDTVSSHGLTYQDYRVQLKREIERRRVVNAMVGSRVRVEEADVQAAYAERFSEQPEGGTTVRIRQVLVTANESRDLGTACDAARAAQRRIAEGEPFEEVAAQVSDVAPEYGGDIGWIHVDRAAPWMTKTIAGLEAGQVSDLVELPFGCSILMLVERREYEPVSFERARPALEQELYEERLSEEYRAWMNTLRKNTYIERKGLFAEAAQFGERTFPVELAPGAGVAPPSEPALPAP